jgi:uncharacterized protein (TIGR02996 family)
MGEDEAFLAAILARPADDTLRLVYADWLDERGDPRADFVRLECWLHEFPRAGEENPSLRRQLGELGQPLDRSWIAAVCRVPVEFDGTAMAAATWADPHLPWAVTSGGVTATGGYRESNEDRIVLDSAHPIALVLDGMGGFQCGERAASAGGETLRGSLTGGPAPGELFDEYVRRSLRVANDAVLALHTDPQLRGIAATVVLAILRGGRVFVSWAGDSMAYRVSGDGVEPLTWRHDSRTLLCRQRLISEEEARQYFWKNSLVYALGLDLPDPIEVLSFIPRPGDRLVLATDGVYNLFQPPELLAACRLHPYPLACAEYLVRTAFGHGSRDNATCVVIAFDGPSS